MPGKPPPPTAVSEIIAGDRNLSVVTAGPPPRRGFTRLDQADFLLAVRGSDPEFAVMHPVLALCSLPRKNPGEALQWRRQNGVVDAHRDSNRGFRPALRTASGRDVTHVL